MIFHWVQKVVALLVSVLFHQPLKQLPQEYNVDLPFHISNIAKTFKNMQKQGVSSEIPRFLASLFFGILPLVPPGASKAAGVAGSSSVLQRPSCIPQFCIVLYGICTFFEIFVI